MDAVAPALKSRFLEDLARLWPEGGALGVAVSGGPDSLALLMLAASALGPSRVEAATVDHRLRPQSAAEAAMVAQLCADWSIRHEVLPVEVPPGNLQSAARLARYAALAAWAGKRGLSALATAHHADDQAETLVMRLNRASGLAGLAGVRGRSTAPGTGVPVVRPLLGWRRQELGALVAGAGIAAVTDPSNSDPRFDRARIRQALADCEWLGVEGLAQSAANLADANEAMEWAVAREWNEQVTIAADVLEYRPKAPRAIRIGVLAWVLAHFGGSARGGELARLADALAAGGSGTLGGVMAQARGDAWAFETEPPRRPEP